ncbi:MAG: outer membrane beta-barrel protein [Candidatus Saccharimonadales bacterium]
MKRLSRGLCGAVALLLMTAVGAFAQFGASIQGSVQDSSGAAVGNAHITLVNVDTQVSRSTIADSSGIYHIPSLAPGNYLITAVAPGFSEQKVALTLLTDENRNIAFTLAVGRVTTTVAVTTQAPLLDTSDSRNQLTLGTKELQSLPLFALNPTELISLAPGVTGLGAGTTNNFFTENLDLSANGRGDNGNIYILDGLDILIDVNPGVLALVPNADALSEVSVQTNTYAVDYGRTSSMQTVMTTKSGTSAYHGLASEYYQYEGLNARGEFGTPQPTPLAPYHTNNMSFQVGGPVIPKHQFFFYFGIEPYLTQSSTGNQVQIFEDPAFLKFAQQAQPNSPEVQLMAKYPPSAATVTGVEANALETFGPQNIAANSGCGTPSTDNIPCDTPVFDTGNFNATNTNKSKQYNLRIDKDFKKDRLYGTWFWSTQNFNGPAVRPAFLTTTVSSDYAIQGNETHTFTPNTLNEASFGYNYLVETTPASGLFTVPVVGVSGLGVGFGDGFALGQFAENNYHWRDVLTHVQGSHVFKFGYEGWHGTDVANFAAAYSQPSFFFTNMINLINNDPYSETGLSYNPVTGKPEPANYEYAMTTGGAFAEDTWKVSKTLTLNYGIRYDNFGNAYPVNGTVLSNFHPGPGATFADRIATGIMTQQSHVTNHDQNWIFSPRVGMAWDPAGDDKWVVRGGFGVYRDWITLGNEENGMSTNPPAFVVPTFYNNGSTSAPIFGYGTSNTYPFGFPYPQFGGQPLNSAGGLSGGQFAVGGVDPNITTPLTTTWSATVERQITPTLVASVGYVGQHSHNLLVASGAPFFNTFGNDVNVFAGDLIQHPGCTPTAGQTVICDGIQTRLNHSFGSIQFNYNGGRSNYSGLIFAVKGRFSHRGFLTASYTRAVSKDNVGTAYPSEYPIDRWYGPSPMDVPNRLSLAANYNLPNYRSGNGLMGRILSGWQLSGVTILQSGYPFSVIATNPFDAQSVNGGPLQFLPDSGDFNADGDNAGNSGEIAVGSYPNVSSYHISTSRKSYINGVFPHCSGTNLDNCGPFSFPTMGQEGNEAINKFRNPGFAQTDMTLDKITKIVDGVNLELRFDMFNIFNRVNLIGVNNSGSSGNAFGTSTSTQLPRTGQISAKVTF